MTLEWLTKPSETCYLFLLVYHKAHNSGLANREAGRQEGQGTEGEVLSCRGPSTHPPGVFTTGKLSGPTVFRDEGFLTLGWVIKSLAGGK